MLFFGHRDSRTVPMINFSRKITQRHKLIRAPCVNERSRKEQRKIMNTIKAIKVKLLEHES